MSFCNGLYKALLALPVLFIITPSADAARARYHYVVGDAAGTLVPSAGPSGATGERRSVLGRCAECNPPRPTCWKCFRHPCTGQNVKIPLALPEGTPNIYYRNTRISFDYGSYNVIIHFLDDGSVDVIYDSGLFRAL